MSKSKKILIFLIAAYFGLTFTGDTQKSDLIFYLDPDINDVKKIGLGQIYTPKNIEGITFRDFRLIWLNSKGIVYPFEGDTEHIKSYDAYTFGNTHKFTMSRAINIGFLGVDLIQDPNKEPNKNIYGINGIRRKIVIDNKNFTEPDKIYFVNNNNFKEINVKNIFVQLINEKLININPEDKIDLEWIVIDVLEKPDVKRKMADNNITDHTKYLFILLKKSDENNLPEFIKESFIYKGKLIPQIPIIYADITDGKIASRLLVESIRKQFNNAKKENVEKGFLYISNGVIKQYRSAEESDELLRLIPRVPPERSFNFLNELKQLINRIKDERTLKDDQNNNFVYHLYLSELTFNWIKEKENSIAQDIRKMINNENEQIIFYISSNNSEKDQLSGCKVINLTRD